MRFQTRHAGAPKPQQEPRPKEDNAKPGAWRRVVWWPQRAPRRHKSGGSPRAQTMGRATTRAARAIPCWRRQQQRRQRPRAPRKPVVQGEGGCKLAFCQKEQRGQGDQASSGRLHKWGDQRERSNQKERLDKVAPQFPPRARDEKRQERHDPEKTDEVMKLGLSTAGKKAYR